MGDPLGKRICETHPGGHHWGRLIGEPLGDTPTGDRLRGTPFGTTNGGPARGNPPADPRWMTPLGDTLGAHWDIPLGHQTGGTAWRTNPVKSPGDTR
jgi:hypothetical protein